MSQNSPPWNSSTGFSNTRMAMKGCKISLSGTFTLIFWTSQGHDSCLASSGLEELQVVAPLMSQGICTPLVEVVVLIVLLPLLDQLLLGWTTLPRPLWCQRDVLEVHRVVPEFVHPTSTVRALLTRIPPQGLQTKQWLPGVGDPMAEHIVAGVRKPGQSCHAKSNREVHPRCLLVLAPGELSARAFSNFFT